MHMVLMCFILLQLYNELQVDLYGLLTHILQGYFTDTGTILRPYYTCSHSWYDLGF